MIKKFNQLNMNNTTIAGGKGASLGEMINNNIPVPDGYVILTKAFEHFLKESNLRVEIEGCLDNVNHEDMNSVEVASNKIQNLILNKNIPKDIELAIVKEFDFLDSKFVAVRSSATAEDGKDNAWAGQLDSFLNTTKDSLLKNVKKCWASLFTPRAIFYRFEKGLHDSHISVAVVVQKMINSEVAGISFSVHPVTEDSNQLIIEAAFGLGEAVVSGSITPDTYVIQKDNLEIIENHVSDQERKLVRIESGGNEWVLVKGDSQKLSDEKIIELTKIIINIEKHYEFPVDVEWAFEKNKFYIVQSRPITTLK